MKTIVWPYIELARHLVKIERKGFGNMFRHQVETFAILIEFGYVAPVLIKASLIHDLIEDGPQAGFTDFERIAATDHDGPEVYKLVEELTRRIKGGREEPKAVFLERIMQTGTSHARLLKLADRLSNVNSLFSTNNKEFIKRYCQETQYHIMSHAAKIDEKMAGELERSLKKLEGFTSV
jgi:(p)ppGpp synthase/HD superfamily hydrolase